MEQFFPIIILALLAIMLFVLPARQRKRMQAQAQALQEALNVGTPVMMAGGLHGTVAALGETTVDVQIAPGVVVTYARQAVLEIRTPAGTPGTDGPDTGTPGASGGRPADGTV
ncbi:preprotein translocase subunit YajC [Blastococcus deserti]|uniref:Preprotein translocase subunit YajC n=1 Tax=Blastococcus deserti TaxID=2259033 RepID=A0ABW4XAB8_9ACTN